MDSEKKVDFSYPEGFEEAAKALTDFSNVEDAKAFLNRFIPYIVMM